MNKHRFLSIRTLMLGVMLVLSSAMMAQSTFRKGALYGLYPATDGKVSLELDGSAIKFKTIDAAAAGQYWTVTELSGSVRIINPFTNQALRADGNKVGVGENNGSDEAQLWKAIPVESLELSVESSHPDGKNPQPSSLNPQPSSLNPQLMLIPANRPEVAMCRETNGTLSLIPVAEARTKNAAAFRLDESPEYGFDADAPIVYTPSDRCNSLWAMAIAVRTMHVS